MRTHTTDKRMPGIAKSRNTSFQPQAAMIVAPRIGVSTGPNFTAERKIPAAVPFSRAGNQLLIVAAMPIGSGPSANPSAIRQIFNENNEPTIPVNPVAIDVRTIEIEKTRFTPNFDTSQAEGSWTAA